MSVFVLTMKQRVVFSSTSAAKVNVNQNKKCLDFSKSYLSGIGFVLGFVQWLGSVNRLWVKKRPLGDHGF